MKRFIVAAALAVALGLGTSSKASAQIVYGYSVPNAGGVVNGGTVFVPGGYKTFENFYSPFTGVTMGNVYGTNVFGQSFGKSYTYNPWLNLGYRTGYVRPSPLVNPLGGAATFGSFYRRW